MGLRQYRRYEAGLGRWRQEVYDLAHPDEALGYLLPVCRWWTSHAAVPAVE